jgi:hypothetical protein
LRSVVQLRKLMHVHFHFSHHWKRFVFLHPRNALRENSLVKYCFSSCDRLSTLTFESGCHLLRICESAFSFCSSLQFICIPAWGEFLGKWCFFYCKSLCVLTLESGCRLTRIDARTFSDCSSLKSICIPGSVELLGSCCFNSCWSLVNLDFESSCNLRRMDDHAFFVLFGALILFYSCFCWTGWQLLFLVLSVSITLTFESGSKLSEFGVDTFLGRLSLKSICFPLSLEKISHTEISMVSVESVHRFFSVSHPFRLDVNENCVIRCYVSKRIWHSHLGCYICSLEVFWVQTSFEVGVCSSLPTYSNSWMRILILCKTEVDLYSWFYWSSLQILFFALPLTFNTGIRIRL